MLARVWKTAVGGPQREPVMRVNAARTRNLQVRGWGAGVVSLSGDASSGLCLGPVAAQICDFSGTGSPGAQDFREDAHDPPGHFHAAEGGAVGRNLSMGPSQHQKRGLLVSPSFGAHLSTSLGASGDAVPKRQHIGSRVPVSACFQLCRAPPVQGPTVGLQVGEAGWGQRCQPRRGPCCSRS